MWLKKKVRWLAQRMLRWSGPRPIRKIDPYEEVTPYASDVFTGFSGCRAQCMCGRDYFAEGDWDFYDGELADLRALAAEKPNRCIEVSESVGGWDMPGGQYVYGCECRYLQKLEWIFWNYRTEILAYIRARVDEQVAVSMKDIENLEKATR